MESENVQDEEEQFNLLKRHMRYIRNHPMWKDSHIVFIPERGTGLAHSALGNMAESFDRVTVFKQKSDVNGVIVTGRVKRSYQINMVDALWDGSIRFERDFFTISKQKGKRIKSEDMIILAREQMERFHWDYKAANDAHGTDRWAMTGKIGEKQDDALMALLMCYTWGNCIQTQTQHQVFLENIRGHRLGRVSVVSERVMKAFQSLKNTPVPIEHDTLDQKLGAMTSMRNAQESVWDAEQARQTKRLRGDPNTLTDMTHSNRDSLQATTKRIRLEPLTSF